MKLLKKKNVLTLLMVIVISGAGVLSYYAYEKYQKNIIEQNSTKVHALIRGIASVLDRLELERINSATYLASHSESHYERVTEKRKEVDRALLELVELLQNNRAFTSYVAKIKQLIKELDKAREKVNNLNEHYKDILFYSYHNQVYGKFLEILNHLTFSSFKEIKTYLSVYKRYAELKENTIAENTMVTYILLHSQILSEEDILYFKEFSRKDVLPDLDFLTDSTLAVDLSEILSKEAYYAISLKEREKILNDAGSGAYSTSLIVWLDKIGKKMDFFSQAQSLLVKEIQKREEEFLEKNKQVTLWYAAALLVLLVVLYRLFLIYLALKSDKQLSEETLKEIAVVFDKNQQKELQRLIDSGKVDHIYKFLIKAIKDANETKDLFLAGMSHEIRTPLNGILGFTQLLKQSNATEEQRESIAVIEKSSEHLLRIVNDILDLSKIKAQKIEMESIAFDPVESFESAVESYAAKAAEEDIDFNIFLDPRLPTQLTGDPTKISQVIVNLVSNAIKFTPKNGEVNVRIELLSETENAAEVKFAVSDSGIGISKEQKAKLFEAFSQADVSTSRKYGGTGLGLNISSKLVQLMGGELKIRSIVNEGSTFYFTVTLNKPVTATGRNVEERSHYTVGILNPHIGAQYYINKNLEAYLRYTGARVEHYTDESLLALKGSATLPDILFVDHKFRWRGGEIEQFIDFDTKVVVISTGDQKKNLERYGSRIDKILYKPVNLTKTLKALSETEDVAESTKQIRFENVHVLVAEDNLINQKLILNLLDRLGIEVSFANNGQEALEERMENEFDMIFMDIEMPVMGGMEATGKILSFEKKSGKEHIPIIALTANALSGDREKYMGAGMEGYLAKPIHLDTLHTLLEEYFKEKIV